METYHQLMETTPSPLDHLHEGKPLTPGILGGPDFMNRLPHRIRARFRTSGNPPSVERIIDYVAKMHRLPVKDILSRCRKPSLVLARAQIAWYATEYAHATLGQVARKLHRDVSTLSRLLGTHRQRNPHCFSPRLFDALRTTTEATPPNELVLMPTRIAPALTNRTEAREH